MEPKDVQERGSMNWTRRQVVAGLVIAPWASASAVAQTDIAGWPSKPIRFIIPQGPAGGVDIVGRMLAEELSAVLKVSVIVENKPGGAAIIGSSYVAKSEPDGYTLLFGFQQIATTNPHLYKNSNFDPITELAPISQVVGGGYILTVTNGLPVRTLPELVAYAKANPGKLTYGSYGVGSGHHLTTELLCQRTGIEMVHVPYKSSPVMDVIGGRIDVLVDATLVAKEHVLGGTIRPIAVTAEKRNPVFPDVPTLSETYPGLVIRGWQAFWAPAGTPQPIIDRLSLEFRKLMQTPKIRQKILDMSAEPTGNTPAEMKDVITREYAMWGEVIRSKNIQIP